jgi:phage major head subunit gpT-like protein
MIVNGANLRTLGISYNALYQQGLGQAPSYFKRVATVVPSTTGSNEYGWLGKMPNVREWLGDRQVQNMSTFGYTIKNKDFELTIGVDRNDIEDDNLGIYGPMFQEMGYSAMGHMDSLTFGLLSAGFTTACFDGQPFFSLEHPITDVNGAPTVYANCPATAGGGGNPAWFLMASKRPLKPLIWQERKPFEFIPRDKPDDANVFSRKEFEYGIDGRHNVGFGFPQFCWGSTDALTSANYGLARQAIMSMKGDYGRPLGLIPDLLVYSPENENAALAILNAEFLPGGAGGSNIYWKTAEPLNVPWLG